MQTYIVTNRNGFPREVRAESKSACVTKVQNYFDLSYEPYRIYTKNEYYRGSGVLGNTPTL